MSIVVGVLSGLPSGDALQVTAVDTSSMGKVRRDQLLEDDELLPDPYAPRCGVTACWTLPGFHKDTKA